jgi:hypothetical protein
MSSLLKVSLVVLGWPLMLLALVTVSGWLRDAAPPAADDPAAELPIHLRRYQRIGEDRLPMFAALPAEDQQSVRASFAARLEAPGKWTRDLDAAGHSVLCLGENHEESTRRFVAQALLERLSVDLLLLEATDGDLADMRSALAQGTERVPLLGADIAATIRSALRHNPTLWLAGIEQTRSQRFEDPVRSAPRDESIARNFWDAYRPGERHAILFGALHCAPGAHWLYGRLRRTAPPEVVEGMLNVRVVGAQQDGPVAGLVRFLDGLGLVRGDFVLTGTDGLHPLFYEWFPWLASEVRTYRALVVFRT